MTSVLVFRNLKVVENPVLDECGEPVDCRNQWKPGTTIETTEEQYPNRTEGLNADTAYSFANEDRCSITAGTSQASYEDWLMMLEEFQRDVTSGDTAFEEMINFVRGHSCEEGIIGPVVAAKLHQDFKKYLAKAKSYSKKYNEYEEGDGDSWFEKYEVWMDAFKFASENGAIEF